MSTMKRALGDVMFPQNGELTAEQWNEAIQQAETEGRTADAEYLRWASREEENGQT